ncbi:MAG: hypothetical protein QM626_06845 [Microbacterium sp.]|uniref:DUF1801 domain-containing protein n=1 Tax=Microbacterium sp. TaxID=51671 RepID=UPI0039E574FF
MATTEVSALIAARQHPLAAAIEQIRAVLLAEPGVTENVKWNSPNFAVADDFATLQLHRDNVVRLVLHTGARSKPRHPRIAIDDLPSCARRADRNRLVLTYTASLTDADAAALGRLVHEWVTQLQ